MDSTPVSAVGSLSLSSVQVPKGLILFISLSQLPPSNLIMGLHSIANAKQELRIAWSGKPPGDSKPGV